MDKFVTKIPRTRNQNDKEARSFSKHRQVQIDLENIPKNPGLRPRMSYYHYNDRDKIRRAYLLRKSTQPLGHTFPSSLIKGQYQKFTKDLFDNEKYKDQLEYSIEKDVVYCLYCYLFKLDAANDDAFVVDGFRNQKKTKRIRTHVKGMSSAHN